MINEEQASKIEKTKEGITWTDEEGKTHKYSVTNRTLYLHLQGLSRCLYMSRFSEQQPIDLPLSNWLVGDAILEDRRLNVIGIPESTSNIVNVSFELLSKEDTQKLKSGNADFSPVSLAYTKKNLEEKSNRDWRCQIWLPASQFNMLNEAHNLEKITKIEIGLDMQDIYSNDDLFIEPYKGLTFQNPRGFVSMLKIETSPRESKLPAPTESTLGSKKIALDNGVKTYLKWIFCALIGLIIVVIGKH